MKVAIKGKEMAFVGQQMFVNDAGGGMKSS